MGFCLSLRGTWTGPCVTPFWAPRAPSAPVVFHKPPRGLTTGRTCDTPFGVWPAGPMWFTCLLFSCSLHLGGGSPPTQRCSVCILVLDLGPWRARGSQAQGYPYFRSVLVCGGLTWAQASTKLLGLVCPFFDSLLASILNMEPTAADISTRNLDTSVTEICTWVGLDQAEIATYCDLLG